MDCPTYPHTNCILLPLPLTSKSSNSSMMYFLPPTMAWGVVTRKDQTSDFQSRSFTSQLLSANLPGKQMHPFRNTVSASSLEEVGGLHAHPGEEFLFVLSGKIFLHTEQNTPLLLETGDCIYFYASHAHAYVNGQNDPSEFLVVTTQPPNFKGYKALTTGNTEAEIRISSPDVRDDLVFFTKELGFRLDKIYPADNPTVVIISGHGVRLRIEKRSARTSRHTAHLM